MKSNYSKYKVLFLCLLVAIVAGCDKGNKDPEPEVSKGCRLKSYKSSEENWYESDRTSITKYNKSALFTYNTDGTLADMDYEWDYKSDGVASGTMKKNFTYDQNGFLTEINIKINSQYNSQISTPTARHTYEYKDGLLSVANYEATFTNGTKDINTKTFEYDSQKKLTKMIEWIGDTYQKNDTRKQTIYSFSDNELKSIQYYVGAYVYGKSILGPLGFVQKFIQDDTRSKIVKYDSKGRVLREEWYMNNTRLTHTSEYTYDMSAKEPTEALPNLKGFPNILCLKQLDTFEDTEPNRGFPIWFEYGNKGMYEITGLSVKGLNLNTDVWVNQYEGTGAYTTNAQNYPLTYENTTYGFRLDAKNYTSKKRNVYAYEACD